MAKQILTPQDEPLTVADTNGERVNIEAFTGQIGYKETATSDEILLLPSTVHNDFHLPYGAEVRVLSGIMLYEDTTEPLASRVAHTLTSADGELTVGANGLILRHFNGSMTFRKSANTTSTSGVSTTSMIFDEYVINSADLQAGTALSFVSGNIIEVKSGVLFYELAP